MLTSWQTWLAALLCLLAAAYVLRRAWVAIAGKKAGCGSGCGSCANTKAATGNPAGPLLSIEPSDRRTG